MSFSFKRCNHFWICLLSYKRKSIPPKFDFMKKRICFSLLAIDVFILFKSVINLYFGILRHGGLIWWKIFHSFFPKSQYINYNGTNVFESLNFDISLSLMSILINIPLSLT